MDQSAADRSRIVAKAIESTIAQVLESPTPDVVRALDGCCDGLLAEDTPAEEFAEIARRIAEAKLSVLFNRADGGVEASNAWRTLEGLGFLSAEREASMLFYVIRSSCDPTIGLGERPALMSRLAGVVRKLEREQPAVAEHFAKVLARLSQR